MTLDDVYRQRCQTRSDIYEHLPFMHNLVVAMDAKVVVELGVRGGNSTAALLAGVERTGGHLWSIDIEPPSWPLEFYGRPRGSLIVGDDLEVADQVPANIDILFIDTSHHYQHTLAELRLYGPEATVILLHDTELRRPIGLPAGDPLYPVRAAIETWCAETGRQREYRTNCYGLGVIR